MSLAGERIGLGAAAETGNGDAAAGQAERLAGWLRGETDSAEHRGFRARTVTGRELLTGSSFALTAGTEGGSGGTMSLWGRGVVNNFDGRDGELSLDGEVVSALLGADWARNPGSGSGAVSAGLIVGRSRGEGNYRGASDGTVRSTLTGVYPWGTYALSERLSVWGLAGYGEGTLTLREEKEVGGGQAVLRTDLDLLMAAAGLRGVLLTAPAGGGPELVIKTDAMGVRTTTAKVEGMEAAEADVTRFRLGLEGSRAVHFDDGGTLTPSVEIGVRHDGGDAETGFGSDIGGGIAWSDPVRGLSAEFRGRGLLGHEAKGFRERGFSGTLSFDPTPGSARGLSLSMSQTVGGASSGGADALLGRETLEGLADDDNGDEFANRRFEMRLGYGLAAFGDRFTMTPEIGFGHATGSREYSLGWRLVREARNGDMGSLELALEARRHENDTAVPGAGAAEHMSGVRLSVRW